MQLVSVIHFSRQLANDMIGMMGIIWIGFGYTSNLI